MWTRHLHKSQSLWVTKTNLLSVTWLTHWHNQSTSMVWHTTKGKQCEDTAVTGSELPASFSNVMASCTQMSKQLRFSSCFLQWQCLTLFLSVTHFLYFVLCHCLPFLSTAASVLKNRNEQKQGQWSFEAKKIDPDLFSSTYKLVAYKRKANLALGKLKWVL